MNAPIRGPGFVMLPSDWRAVKRRRLVSTAYGIGLGLGMVLGVVGTVLIIHLVNLPQ